MGRMDGAEPTVQQGTRTIGLGRHATINLKVHDRALSILLLQLQ